MTSSMPLMPPVAALASPSGALPPESTIYSSPAVANGIVYVGSDDHKLYAFDASCRNCLPAPLELSHRRPHRLLTSGSRWHGLRRLLGSQALRLWIGDIAVWVQTSQRDGNKGYERRFSLYTGKTGSFLLNLKLTSSKLRCRVNRAFFRRDQGSALIRESAALAPKWLYAI